MYPLVGIIGKDTIIIYGGILKDKFHHSGGIAWNTVTKIVD